MPPAEKTIEQEKQIREEYQKRLSTAVEHFNKGELDKAYENLKSAQEVMNTPEAKELEGKIINGFIAAVENYYKQANYPGARISLDQAKKIIPGGNFQALEQAIELLKEMPAHVQAVLKESKLKETRIDRKNNGWQADFGDGIVMVYIPAGTFKKGDSTDIKSLQEISLDGFWMGKTEVSRAQYMKFARETGTNYPKEGIEQKGNDYPLVGISWDNAAAYCQWLSGKTGLEFKLPTEAQWEKAARGTDGRMYPWGNQEPDRNLANFLNPSGTDKVNSHVQGASPYGLLNMAGNVAEWCGDVLTGREQDKRAARGGSFFNNAQDITCFSRRTWSPSERLNTLGFRVCLGSKN